MNKNRMVHQTEETRSKILAAAESMFVEKGFADTQMKDIAMAIGMSRNTLYRYYQDKFDLGFAILVNVLTRKAYSTFDDLEAVRRQGYANALDGLRTLFLSMCDDASQLNARFSAEFDAYYSGDRIPDNFRKTLLAALPMELHEKIFDQLISEGQANGDIRTDLSPRQISVILINSIPMFHRRMILRQHALVEVEAHDVPPLTPAFINILLDGLRPVTSKKEIQ